MSVRGEKNEGTVPLKTIHMCKQDNRTILILKEIVVLEISPNTATKTHLSNVKRASQPF